jgi:hypothetical protein
MNIQSMINIKDPSNLGYVFEQILYNKLQQLQLFDEIHYETELTRKWGWDASSVDYLLVYKNKVIVLQAKWRKTRRRENAHINNFIKSIKHITSSIDGKTMILGLWVSRRKPFEDNISQLMNHNVICISNFDSMTSLANHMADILEKCLKD